MGEEGLVLSLSSINRGNKLIINDLGVALIGILKLSSRLFTEFIFFVQTVKYLRHKLGVRFFVSPQIKLISRPIFTIVTLH